MLAFVGFGDARAQKTLMLRDWVKHQKDSLNKNGVDTIIYYHNFCGECSVVKQKANFYNCEVYDNGWELVESRFIYKQNGNIFSLKFNYCNLPIITQIKDSRSIPYFLSIIPMLKQRDKVDTQRKKLHKFFPPIPTPTDGFYEDTKLYLHKSEIAVSLSGYQKEEGYKYYKSFFWIDKEIKLMQLIEQDITQSTNTQNEETH